MSYDYFNTYKNLQPIAQASDAGVPYIEMVRADII
jgi:hypothetical protein